MTRPKKAGSLVAEVRTILGPRLAKTHWGKRILAAAKRGGFTEGDGQDSMDWTTCACGKQDPRILRTSWGHPADGRLALLGTDFAGRVCDLDDPAAAARTLVAIEKRAAEILADLEAT